MAEDSPEIQENVINTQVGHTYTAIDSFCNSREQTYDEFIDSFTFLTKNDVNQPPSGGLMNQNAGSSSEINTNSKDDVIMHSPRDLPTSDIECELEELEEEVLDEGTRPPSVLMRTPDATGGATVKLGNFIDDEGDALSSEEGEEEKKEEDLESQDCSEISYTASFDKAREQKKHPQALDSTGQPIEAADNTDDPPLSPRLDSFELPVNAVYPGEIEDIQESPRQKDLLKMRHLDISTTAGGSTENAPDGSTGNTLCGSTGNAPGGSTGNALGGSTGSTQDGSTEHLLGGTTESASTASKVPELGSNELSVKDPDKESGGKDEVEPFSLDDDHDYDTFTITPKYSAQELEIINAAIRQGRQEAKLAKQRQDAST